MDILKSPFVVLGNIFKYAFMGIKYMLYDLWADLYAGASYSVDKTYQTTKQAFLSEEDKLYERTKKKPKKEKAPTAAQLNAQARAKLISKLKIKL